VWVVRVTRFELMTENEVAFKMIRNNLTSVRRDLDSLRRRRHKFICLNDNIDHTLPDADKVRRHQCGRPARRLLTGRVAQIKLALHELYEWYFPLPSSFELPPGQENAHLYIDELRDRCGVRTCPVRGAGSRAYGGGSIVCTRPRCGATEAWRWWSCSCCCSRRGAWCARWRGGWRGRPPAPPGLSAAASSTRSDS
jgi:hypothetical protein